MESLHRCVSSFREIEIVGQTDNLDEAFLLFQNHRPRAAFMDIKLIGGSAFQLLERLQRSGIDLPAIVLVSGYPTEAVTALNDYGRFVVHFIEKPYLDGWQSKFRNAIDDLLVSPQIRSAQPADHIFLRTSGAIERIPIDAVAWIEVLGPAKCCVFTDTAYYEVNQTLNRIMNNYPEIPLQKCTRDIAINLNRLIRLDTRNHHAIIRYDQGQKEFTIGPVYYQTFLELMSGKN